MTVKCSQSTQGMLWWSLSWLQWAFCNYNNFSKIISHLLFIKKRNLHFVHKNWSSHFWGNGVIWYWKIFMPEILQNSTVQRLQCTLLILKAIYDFYVEHVTVTAWGIIFNYTMFRILENTSLEMHPKIFLLGASKAHPVFSDEVFYGCRGCSGWKASVHCHFGWRQYVTSTY